MSTEIRETREVGGADRLDLELERVPAAPLPKLVLRFFTRSAALGLSPGFAPALVFVPLGALLGPSGFALLAEGAFGVLDGAVSVALGTLGIFVGLAAGRGGRDTRRLAAAATVEAVTTVVVVSSAIGLLLLAWGAPIDARFWGVVVALGLVSAASSAGAAELADGQAAHAATALTDLDDLVPIVAGGVLLGWMAGGSVRATATLVALTVGTGVSGGLAGYLLTSHARSENERTVFAVGAVLLVAGGAAYLSASPLLSGLAAGLVWSRTGAATGRVFDEELKKLQHPTVLLLLLTAGVGLRLGPSSIWLAIPLVVFRLVGKLAGGELVRRCLPGEWPAGFAGFLIPPGVIGLGLALNVQQAVTNEASAAIVSAAALSAIAGEVIGLAVIARGRWR